MRVETQQRFLVLEVSWKISDCIVSYILFRFRLIIVHKKDAWLPFHKKKLCNSSLKLQRVIHTVPVPKHTALMAKGLTEHGMCYLCWSNTHVEWLKKNTHVEYSWTSIALVLRPILQAQETNETKPWLHLHGGNSLLE